MKPTPGPYTTHILDCHKSSIGAYVQQCVEASGGNDFYFISASHEDGGSVDVAHIGNGPRGKANAAFIVRACNSHEAMLEALKAILDHGRYDDAGNFVIDCESWDGQGNPPDTTDPLCIQAAWAAIRLAEGRG